MWVLTIVISILFLIISYQDFKQRLIDWYLFPILAVLIIIFVWFYKLNSLSSSLFNIASLLLLLISSSLYYTLKFRKFINILDQAIGLADIIIFLLIGIVFSPLNFIVFLLCSFIIGVLFKLFNFSKQESEIPLAGIIGVLASICIIYQTTHGDAILSNDTYFLQLFYSSLIVSP